MSIGPLRRFGLRTWHGTCALRAPVPLTPTTPRPDRCRTPSQESFPSYCSHALALRLPQSSLPRRKRSPTPPSLKRSPRRCRRSPHHRPRRSPSSNQAIVWKASTASIRSGFLQLDNAGLAMKASAVTPSFPTSMRLTPPPPLQKRRRATTRLKRREGSLRGAINRLRVATHSATRDQMPHGLNSTSPRCLRAALPHS